MGCPFHPGDGTAAGGPQSDGVTSLLDVTSHTTIDQLGNRHASSTTPEQSVLERTGHDDGTADRTVTGTPSGGSVLPGAVDTCPARIVSGRTGSRPEGK